MVYQKGAKLRKTSDLSGVNPTQRLFSRMRNPDSEFIYVKDTIAAIDVEIKEADAVEILRPLLEEKKQIILYGPPGTGKTWFARKFAPLFLRGAISDEEKESSAIDRGDGNDE